MDCLIRIATAEDSTAISKVIINALRESNALDYSPEIILQVEEGFSPKAIIDLLIQRQVYVATIRGQVVATASLDRDVVRSVFVDPPHQGTGIGRQLMTMLLEVAVNGRIERLRVPSSITAEGFYSSLGFNKIRDEFHGAERTIIMERLLGLT
ncbi:GNAT family N-acetyltransferase [Pseudomonas sp. DSP3-2-2]|uniref:GNAT family N-acetyltransferase n=1 Tax=unclassified Pseudomonas TaxID=196821 RepID=UPI003CECF28E